MTDDSSTKRADWRRRLDEAITLPSRGDADVAEPSDKDSQGVKLTDFYAHMPSHRYIFAPTGDPWPAASVNARIPPVTLYGRDEKPLLDQFGKPKKMRAASWLDRNRPVEQMTWAPGWPMIIRDRLISEGGLIPRLECKCFNLYRPPITEPGNPALVGPWVELIQKVYSDEASHIINFLAHRTQRPQEKINHALVLGGAQGIGKDTMLEPIKYGIGPWNFQEVSPKQMLGRFNGFAKSVILRVSEARDLGDFDRFAFYDHTKAFIAAPPDVIRVDEKHVPEYSVFNVCGVIITSNHKTDGIYLPADDRRHFVAWSPLTKEDFSQEYWNELWAWYEAGGNRHVVTYLQNLDLGDFNPKAPPPKTEAFWAIVDASRTPEDADLLDALEKLGNPAATTIESISLNASETFRPWLLDRKNRRALHYRLEECGYETVRNPVPKDGYWKFPSGRRAIYARTELSVRDRLLVAEKLVSAGSFSR